MRRIPIFLTTVVAILCASASLRADEIRLKDGSKITGTIVGFENDSFRVETPYGFALIRKDMVADINISAPKKDAELKAKPPAQPQSTTSPQPGAAPAVVKQPSSPSNPSSSPDSNAIKQARSSAGSEAGMAAATSQPAAAKSIPVAATSAPAGAAAQPVPPPAPEPLVIRDEIRGNLYVNLTYGFQMYRPPSWELIPGARTALPDAVAALGTYDQTTLLVIGREHAKDSLDAHAAATEKALGDVYENHRLISSRHLSVAGVPAIEQHSRGSADGRDWSVTLLTLYKGNDAYTLLGMTWADSDLIQVQENVIAKAVSSLTFTQ